MTSADQYVASVLSKYAVPSGQNSPTVRTADMILPDLRSWAGYWLDKIMYSGSYVKGTAVKGTTDIDLFISLRSDIPHSLKELYESLYRFAYTKGWSPRRQNVSIGIKFNNVDIDLVPARIQSGYQNYHSLYRSKVDSWTQTNISLHINSVQSSNRDQEIRAVKIWRMLHQLEFPSFYLELIVIDALKNQRYENLALNVLAALDFIANYIPVNRYVDPANTNNIISNDLTEQEKRIVASQARTSRSQQSWNQIIW